MPNGPRPGRIAPGTTSDVPVMTADLLPTALEVAGVSPGDATIDGVSLLPLLAGGDAPERDALFWHFPAYLQGYREEHGLAAANTLVEPQRLCQLATDGRVSGEEGAA